MRYFIILIGCALLFSCAPNKESTRIQNETTSSACLGVFMSKTSAGDSLDIDSIGRLPVKLDSLGHLVYQDCDSLNFTFFEILNCGVSNVQCNVTLIDSFTARISLTYNTNPIACNCLRQITVAISSKVNDLSHITKFLAVSSKEPILMDSLVRVIQY